MAEQLDRLGSKRAFLMVSGTLNRETGEIETYELVGKITPDEEEDED